MEMFTNVRFYRDKKKFISLIFFFTFSSFHLLERNSESKLFVISQTEPLPCWGKRNFKRCATAALVEQLGTR